MNDYEINDYESIEHFILTKLFQNTSFLTGRFDPNDLFAEYKNKIVIAEFKSRHYCHKQFDWILEKDKLNLLQKKAKKQTKKTNIYYINYFYDDNYLIIWDVAYVFSHFKPVEITKKLNKHSTIGFNGYNEKIAKKCFYLKNEWAKNIIDLSDSF